VLQVDYTAERLQISVNADMEALDPALVERSESLPDIIEVLLQRIARLRNCLHDPFDAVIVGLEGFEKTKGQIAPPTRE
jgi:hypothetical protein